MATLQNWIEEIEDFEGSELKHLIKLKKAISTLLDWDYFAEEFHAGSLRMIRELLERKQADLQRDLKND